MGCRRIFFKNYHQTFVALIVCNVVIILILNLWTFDVISQWFLRAKCVTGGNGDEADGLWATKLVASEVRLQKLPFCCTPTSRAGTHDTHRLYAEADLTYAKWVFADHDWTSSRRDALPFKSLPLHQPIDVHIVPFSHIDPLWLGYIDDMLVSSNNVLSNVIQRMRHDLTMTMAWSEINFLQHWWENSATADDRQLLQDLVKEGRFEILTGGLVMPDESLNRIESILAQLVEGQLWLFDNLQVVPSISWPVDTFGYSSSVQHLLRMANISNIVLHRIHYGLKRHLAQSEQLVFKWKNQYGHFPSDGSTHDYLLTHIMPFISYSIRYSCGPDPEVCCNLYLDHRRCWKGNNFVLPTPASNASVKDLAEKLMGQLRTKAAMYGSDVVLFEIGDDRLFVSESDFSIIENLHFIIRYINSQPIFNAKLHFSTLSAYFEAIRSRREVWKLPTITGDFLPYSDRQAYYWTGYYATRPYVKALIGYLHRSLEAADSLLALTVTGTTWTNPHMLAQYFWLQVKPIRKLAALTTHHDTIAGTCRSNVLQRLSDDIQGALSTLDEVQSQLLLSLLTTARWTQPTPWFGVWAPNAVVALLDDNDLPANWTKELLLFNPAARARHELVRLRLPTGPFCIVAVRAQLLMRPSPLNASHYVWHNVSVFQLSPDIGLHKAERIFHNYGRHGDDVSDSYTLELSFLVHLKQLSVSRLLVSIDVQPAAQFCIAPNLRRFVAAVHSAGGQDQLMRQYASLFSQLSDAQAAGNAQKLSNLVISNRFVGVKFSSCTGLPARLIDISTGRKVRLDMHLKAFRTGGLTQRFLVDRSGPYIFSPNMLGGRALAYDASLLLVDGPIYSSASMVTADSFAQGEFWLTKSPDFQLTASNLNWRLLINIADSRFDNSDIMMSMVTDIDNGDIMYTDANDLHMHQRKYNDRLPLPGNMYPVTSAMWIENESKSGRLTLHVQQPTGVASRRGEVLVMLDRRLLQDDWRGLDEGVVDQRPTLLRYQLLWEPAVLAAAPTASAAPSLHAHRLKLLLHSPVRYFAQLPNAVPLPYLKINFPNRRLVDGLPMKLPYAIDIKLWRLVKLESKGWQFLVVFHKPPLNCDLNAIASELDNADGVFDESMDISFLYQYRYLFWAKETTITGVKSLKTLDEASLKTIYMHCGQLLAIRYAMGL